MSSEVRPTLDGRVLTSQLKKAGKSLSNDLCPHFKMSRPDLFNVVKCVRRPAPPS